MAVANEQPIRDQTNDGPKRAIENGLIGKDDESVEDSYITFAE